METISTHTTSIGGDKIELFLHVDNAVYPGLVPEKK